MAKNRRRRTSSGRGGTQHASNTTQRPAGHTEPPRYGSMPPLNPDRNAEIPPGHAPRPIPADVVRKRRKRIWNNFWTGLTITFVLVLMKVLFEHTQVGKDITLLTYDSLHARLPKGASSVV